MNHYLNTFLSNLKQPFRFRLRKYSAYLMLILLIVFSLLSRSELVQDWENRFQPNFYAFKKSFFESQNKDLPIILVTINDLSLPENMPRSPLNRDWLADLLSQLKLQQPAVIGLNILLDRKSDLNSDLKLAEAFENQTIILRNNHRYPVLKQFSQVSKSSGALNFKFDSSGTLHYICNAPNSCRFPTQFHTEILKAYAKKTKQVIHQKNTNWLKINYFTTHHQKNLNTFNFPVIQADEIEKLPIGALKDKIVLIGTDFPDLYPLYRVPSGNHEMQEIEVIAHTLNSIASNATITAIPFWISLTILLVLLALPSFFTYGNNNWLNAVQTIFIIIFLYLLSAFSFSTFNIEIPFVLPVLLLTILFVNHTGLLHFNEKINRLETEMELKQTKIDFLSNELHSHSLFNELTRLSVLIRQNPTQAREYLVEFAEMLRASLKFGDQLMVPIRNQVEYLKSYINQQQIIFGERLIINFSFDEKLSNFVAPWHIFYPLVENAIKYTEALLKTEDRASTIRMNLELINHQIHFSISNPFHGNLKVASTKTGLKNLKKRLDFAYSSEQYKLESHFDDSIWTSILTIPASKIK
jgi:CHASE2 domain-containing sensor protein